MLRKQRVNNLLYVNLICWDRKAASEMSEWLCWR